MTLAFFSILLNHHQLPVADEFFKILGDNYHFIAVMPVVKSELKGGHDYSNRPYCIKTYESEAEYKRAMDIALTADVCVFDGNEVLPFFIARAKTGKLSFDLSERWLKRGILNMLSPRLQKHYWMYICHLRKPSIYKLCASAFSSHDDNMIGMYRGKHFKWGYFTHVEDSDVEASSDVSTTNITPLMWCSRYLMWKHPELPIMAAGRLKDAGYHFVIDMFGSGEYEEKAQRLAKELDVEDVVRFKGNVPNEQLILEMRKHEIFLFTSDRNEGWGAVANESLANGCALVASDAIGSAPWLVKDGKNGFLFRSSNTSCSFDSPDHRSLESLVEKIRWMLDNPEDLQLMRREATKVMKEVWSPKVAAERFLILSDNLMKGNGTTFLEGPCSKA